MMACYCPNCDQNEGFNTGLGIGVLTCSVCGAKFPVEELVERDE